MQKILVNNTNSAMDNKRQNYFSEKILKINMSKSIKSSFGSGFLIFIAKIAFT